MKMQPMREWVIRRLFLEIDNQVAHQNLTDGEALDLKELIKSYLYSDEN